MTKRFKCKEVGLVINKPSEFFNHLLIAYTNNKKHFFNFKGLVNMINIKYKGVKLTEFINHLLKENKQLKDEKNILNGMKLIE